MPYVNTSVKKYVAAALRTQGARIGKKTMPTITNLPSFKKDEVILYGKTNRPLVIAPPRRIEEPEEMEGVETDGQYGKPFLVLSCKMELSDDYEGFGERKLWEYEQAELMREHERNVRLARYREAKAARVERMAKREAARLARAADLEAAFQQFKDWIAERQVLEQAKLDAWERWATVDLADPVSPPQPVSNPSPLVTPVVSQPQTSPTPEQSSGGTGVAQAAAVMNSASGSIPEASSGSTPSTSDSSAQEPASGESTEVTPTIPSSPPQEASASGASDEATQMIPASPPAVDQASGVSAEATPTAPSSPLPAPAPADPQAAGNLDDLDADYDQAYAEQTSDADGSLSNSNEPQDPSLSSPQSPIVPSVAAPVVPDYSLAAARAARPEDYEQTEDEVERQSLFVPNADALVDASADRMRTMYGHLQKQENGENSVDEPQSEEESVEDPESDAESQPESEDGEKPRWKGKGKATVFSEPDPEPSADQPATSLPTSSVRPRIILRLNRNTGDNGGPGPATARARAANNDGEADEDDEALSDTENEILGLATIPEADKHVSRYALKLRGPAGHQ